MALKQLLSSGYIQICVFAVLDISNTQINPQTASKTPAHLQYIQEYFYPHQCCTNYKQQMRNMANKYYKNIYRIIR